MSFQRAFAACMGHGYTANYACCGGPAADGGTP
jgi:hypothetical protein